MNLRQTTLALVLAALCAASANAELPFDVEPVTSFDEPWALAFLPDGRMLVTEKKGSLFIATADGQKLGVRWVPDVDYGGQGGLGDVALHPDFASNNLIYLSYAESGEGRYARRRSRPRTPRISAGAVARCSVMWR